MLYTNDRTSAHLNFNRILRKRKEIFKEMNYFDRKSCYIQMIINDGTSAQ